jgi:mono/diheme cytochrome c family protein
MRAAGLCWLLFASLMICLTAPTLAKKVGSPARRGEALLTTNCARCHAVGRSGVSPHPQAPAFRTLSRKFKVEGLAEALAEGISTGHPDMPEFVFEADEVGAIIDYLKSIQQR